MGVLDEVAAIDGTRPLEQIADSSGIAWGGMCIQMTADMGGFAPLRAAGKSLTPSQQAWDPLSLEGNAQLQMKRTQNRALGRMRSLCWTDHANCTRQADKTDIEVKHLRWYSEIVADGSEIRSLSGRTAVLGDGISRNPIDRNEIMDQRGKDLQGYAAQIRGFDLDEFLSDWEDPGMPVPWTVGDHAQPSPEEKTTVAPSGATSSTTVGPSGTTSSASAIFDSVFTALGCKHVVKVLFLPDYVATGTRLSEGGAIWRELQMLMPQHELRI